MAAQGTLNKKAPERKREKQHDILAEVAQDHPEQEQDPPKTDQESHEPVIVASQPHRNVTSEQFQEVLLSACDPQIPTRAAALRTLSRWVEQREAIALKDEKKLLQVSRTHCPDT